MGIRNRVGNNKAYESGWDKAFGKKKTTKAKAKTTKPKEDSATLCNFCYKGKKLTEIKSGNRTSIFYACKNKKCEKYMTGPERIKGCINKDSFTYRAGANMEKAKGERRAAEKASHMGGTDEIYRKMDDLNNDKTWGEVK